MFFNDSWLSRIALAVWALIDKLKFWR